MTDARRFFDAIARRYDRVYALSGTASKERLARVIRLLDGKPRVLVLGVGTGRELPALFDSGHDVVGVDASPEMIALCNNRSRVPSLILADFWEPLPFADNSFDAVIALHGTLAHPPRRDAHADLAREIARVLAARGVFVAELPAAEGLAKIATASDGGAAVATSATTFVHHDEIANLSIEGVAWTAAGWRDAFAPALDAQVSPLGVAEHLVVATRGE